MKKLGRAAIVLRRKHFAMQRQLLDYWALAGHSFAGCSVTANGDESIHIRCLNETRRAISAKLEAARRLTSIGLVITQSFQPEKSDILEQSDTEKIISLAGSVPTF